MNIKKLHTLTKRKSMDSSADPYLNSESINEAKVCRRCHAVFQNKRWYLDDELYQKKVTRDNIKSVLCPACRKMKDNFPGGIVKLRGKFLHEHKSEILNMIKNEEQKAMGFNPLERIMEIKNSSQGIEISTTNVKLAQRIGRRLQRAYQGSVAYKWSDDTKLLRAEWVR